MRNTSLFPPAIIAFAEAKKSDSILKAEKDFSTEEEYIHYLTHKVNNLIA